MTAGKLAALLVLQAATAMAQTAPPPAGVAADTAASPESSTVSEVVVTASREDLLGRAISASQGSVSRKEVELRPILRIGQLYETVPGLAVTVHSGEGKANQYLLRGFNLDHGTDFASFVDGMPVNRPTNAHGQGYSDQNFLLPQLVAGVDYTKGPYDASIGDFGAVGSAHVRLVDALPDQISASAGTLRDQELFVGGTRRFGDDDRLWAAFDVGHLDGPWSQPGDFNKLNAAARFSRGSDANGYSVTGLYYSSEGRMETDQSIYAMKDGLIGRYGTLDPSDASRSERLSLSGRYGAQGDRWRFTSGLYAIHSTMTLWNDFTHYLFDQANGDQEEQDETRTTFGGDAALSLAKDIGSIRTDTTLGLQARDDGAYVDRRHTRRRVPLDYCELANAAGTDATPYAAVNGACSADRVRLYDLGVYVETITRWTPWLRTVLGLRAEDYAAADRSLTLGVRRAGAQTLLQPKGGLVLGPWFRTELYVSAGRGFHSDDVRGVFQTAPLEGVQNLAVGTPLMAPATGEEVGLRSGVIPKVQVQFAVFQENFSSELAYDQDQGEDQASAPSRRQGVELSGQYRPFRWIELNADLAVSRARYDASPAGLAAYGLAGPYIANAPRFIGSFGVLVDKLGPWSGGLQWRDLGPYPVEDGEQYPQAKGYSEVNIDLGYAVNSRLEVRLGVFNLFNSKADAAAYDYTSRLVPGGPEITGLQVHPLEPISARLTVTATF